ncbi:MAG: methyltransferase domain-containing protein [Cyanobacteria bacterium P01_H01_bin.58]
MATVLRTLSYRYQWLYDFISRTAALSVGGEQRFRHLPLEGLDIRKESKVLDLCCGSGQATAVLAQYSKNVTGLDASPLSVRRAEANVPQATFVEGWAENMPLSDNQFDIVHTSAAMHEMEPAQRKAIFQEALRVLKPGGVFTLMDFHAPQNWLFWPGFAVFLWLFETETSWQMLRLDLPEVLEAQGFTIKDWHFQAGGSLQVIQAVKPLEDEGSSR